MIRYIFRRLLAVLPTMLGISIIVFLIMHMIPGDTISAMIGTKFKLTDAQMIALREYFGLDQPLYVQYFRWLWNAIHGNFGISVRTGFPVTYEILSRVPLTLELTFFSVIIGLGFGMPVGILSAIHQGKPMDWFGRIISLIGLATPSFWLGTLIIYALSVYFKILPNAGNFVDFSQNPIENLKQIFFPAFVLSFDFGASIIRTSRASMLEEISKEYITTARSKGLKNRTVIIRHCLRNALIPIITLVGLQTGYMFGGAIIVENIFSIPGIGRLLLNAINQRDYALVQGTIVFVAGMFVIVNLIADLTYVLADPRIKYE
jgi:peptide/nickel transport system permease protein